MLPDSSQDSTVRRGLIALILLGLVCLIGNYFYAGFFGIYEDDYFYTIPAFQWSWSECWAHVRHDLLAWPQGRPIGYAANDLITWLSARGSSLELGYALGAALLVTNTVLCYRLAATWFAPLGAFAAAAVYCLNPADTAKVILMHRSFLLLGSTFLLSALLAYRCGRFRLAYVAAALSLLTYESFFFPFLAAPLLLRSGGEFSWRRLLRHGAICAVLVAAVILVRRSQGDTRVTETMGALGAVAHQMSQAVVLGPWTCLQMLVLRPLDALRSSGFGQWCVMGLLVLATVALFPGRDVDSPQETPRERLRALLCLGAGCLLLLALGYVAAIHPGNYPPVVTIGRLSGFNAPSALALGLLVGALVTALAGALPRPRVVAAVTGLLLGALVSFGLEIQRVDYVRNWQQQRGFWDALLADSGEWEPGAVVLVQIEGDAGRPCTPGFPPFWMVNYPPLLAERLVVSPAAPAGGSSLPPHVFGFHLGTKLADIPAGRQLRTPPWSDASLWPFLREGHFLYYNYLDGHLARKTAPFTLDGHVLTPKPLPATPLPPLPKTHLYQILFGSSPAWPTISSARNYPP
jgi:hypothetical protein